MRLDARQLDRAVGAVTGSAAGDALGVPYEFRSRLDAATPAQMLGGGLGDYAVGQWSDDTEMATAILDVAADAKDLRTAEALDGIADGFLRWYATRPPDVGNQTRQVLGRVEPGPGSGERMRAAAAALHEATGHTAGNGSLMRTSPVALAHLGDPDAIATAARAISDLTHADPTAGDACVLWCLAIDHAIRTGHADVRIGLDRVDPSWSELIHDAERKQPHEFGKNGWVVTAFQAAWSAIHHTTTLEDGLQAAVHAGHDTDTVAAIAGGLLGATYGGSVVPAHWRRLLHGYPGYRHRDLVRLAVLAAGGKPDTRSWPNAATLDEEPRPWTVPHPDDEGVILGPMGSLRPGVAQSAVSLCRVGREQGGATFASGDHVEVWLVDQDDANNDIPRVLDDVAHVVRDLRQEGKTVFLHCHGGRSRTPAAAAAYGALVTGTSRREALARVVEVLPDPHPGPYFVDALEQLDAR